MSSYPLKLSASVKTAAQRLAREEGVSLNQWIALVVADASVYGPYWMVYVAHFS
jgi:hypothetical protein